MFHHSRRIATIFAGALGGCSVLTLASVSPAIAQSAQFSDVSFSYWARPFIEQLAEKNIIKGFPDGSFKPNEPVTRAQFAAIVRQAFNEDPIRRFNGFKDVDPDFWATPAISQAFTTGFLSGYPSNEFRPKQNIPKVQALVALTSGLKLEPQGAVDQSLSRFNDADKVPDYAKPGIAAATESGLVVNNPNVNFLNPNDVATRADIAAFVYQALVSRNQLTPLASTERATRFIVKGNTAAGTQTPTTAAGRGQVVTRGAKIPLTYVGSQRLKLVLTPGETADVSFSVAEDISNASNRVLIPKGSLVSGRLVPFNVNSTTGTQFVAQTLRIGNQSYPFNAISNPIVPADNQSITPNSVQNGLATTAAQAALGSILGRRGGGILGGGGSILGGGGGGLSSILANVLLNQGADILRSRGSTTNTSTSNSVIIIDPDELELTTQRNLNLAAR